MKKSIDGRLMKIKITDNRTDDKRKEKKMKNKERIILKDASDETRENVSFVLHEQPFKTCNFKGKDEIKTWQFVRENAKNRSVVKNRFIEYRFNNVPEYKHQYLSWANLALCGGFAVKDMQKTIYEAVVNNRKLVGELDLFGSNEEIPSIIEKYTGSLPDGIYCPSLTIWPESINRATNKHHLRVWLTRSEGALADYFNFEEVRDQYLRLVNPETKEYMYEMLEDAHEYFNIPLKELVWAGSQNSHLLYNGGYLPYEYSIINSVLPSQTIITGLLFGYPIESTASLLEC